MIRIAALLVAAVCFVPPAYGQTTQSDSQTMQAIQAILAELRSMHNDVRLGQTTQILLTELEVQENAVTRATQRRDELRTRLSQVQSNEKNIALQMSQDEEQASKTIDAIQTKRLSDMQNQLKASMVAQTQQEKDWTNDLADAENALRKEQDTLQSIQDQLATVIRKLQPASN